MAPSNKLYIVVRADLEPGSQVVQACHALRQFVEEHPGIDRVWYQESNTLVAVSVPSEEELLGLYKKATRRNFRCAVFREPDLCGEATSLVVESRGKSLCKKLPLALAS